MPSPPLVEAAGTSPDQATRSIQLSNTVHCYCLHPGAPKFCPAPLSLHVLILHVMAPSLKGDYLRCVWREIYHDFARRHQEGELLHIKGSLPGATGARNVAGE